MDNHESRLQELKERTNAAARKVAVAQSQNQESKNKLKEILKELKGKGISSVEELDKEIDSLKNSIEQRMNEAEKALDEAGL